MNIPATRITLGSLKPMFEVLPLPGDKELIEWVNDCDGLPTPTTSIFESVRNINEESERP